MSRKDRARLLGCFGNRLKQLRLARKITKSQFEIMSGIDPGNLSKYERGDREPGLLVIIIMAKALETTVKDVLDFEFEYDP